MSEVHCLNRIDARLASGDDRGQCSDPIQGSTPSHNVFTVQDVAGWLARMLADNWARGRCGEGIIRRGTVLRATGSSAGA